ncbi:unnamed protein product, partial [Rotaria sp. Silwood2]
MPGEAPIS